MKTIAFDLMGNDSGVQSGVEATLAFLKKQPDYFFILVGDKKEIIKYVSPSKRIQIVDCKNVATKDRLMEAVRNDNFSLKIALKLVKDKKADIVISSGDSAVYLVLATLVLRKLDKVLRPAFMPILPTTNFEKKFLLLDVGANLETSSQMLVQWAKLGTIFANAVLQIKNPSVALVNIGVEKNKGKTHHQEAYSELQKNNLNFQGFVEPRNLLNDVVDVAVVDGYAGNMILKTMEGTVLSLLKLIKQQILLKKRFQLGYLLARQAFQNVKKVLDYRNAAAAWILGLDKLALKCHGNADKKSYLGAFAQIHKALMNHTLDKFKEALNV